MTPIEPIDPAEIERRNEEALREYDRISELGPPDDQGEEIADEDDDEVPGVQDPGQ